MISLKQRVDITAPNTSSAGDVELDVFTDSGVVVQRKRARLSDLSLRACNRLLDVVETSRYQKTFTMKPFNWNRFHDAPSALIDVPFFHQYE